MDAALVEIGGIIGGAFTMVGRCEDEEDAPVVKIECKLDGVVGLASAAQLDRITPALP